MWKPIEGFAGVYSVSRTGHVRIEVDRHNLRAGSFLKQTQDPDGYFYVGLGDGSQGSRRNYRVHRLVHVAFIGPIPEGYDVNHADGDKGNNSVDNLEAMTKADNIKHAIEKLGRCYKGEKNPAAQMTDELVLELRERASRGENYVALGRAFGISNVMAGNIASGKSWGHVGGPRTGPRMRGRPPRS